MHIVDMSPRPYPELNGLVEVVSVGWLDTSHTIPAAAHPPALLDAIRARLALIEVVYISLGIYTCPFCSKVQVSGEYHFYNPATRRGYVAPALFLHFMEEHYYAPPKEFIQAVLNPRTLDDYTRALEELENQMWVGMITEEDLAARQQEILSQ